VVAAAGVLALAGCCDCDRVAAPPPTVDVTWMTTTPPTAAEPSTIATVVMVDAEAAWREIVSSAQADAAPPTTAGPAPTSVPASTTPPLVATTAPAPVAPPPPSAPPAPPAAMAAAGCAVAPPEPFVGAIPMRRGDHGDRVLGLQVMLRQLGFDLGRSGVDGAFGPDTEDAFERYQFGTGAPVTGVVCMEDWDALVAATGYVG
jgi:hypothetical protein